RSRCVDLALRGRQSPAPQKMSFGRGPRMAHSTGARFDVAAFIDERPIGWREITTLAVVSVALFIDGFDMYFFGKMLPAIADGLGVSPVGMTAVVTAQ